MEKKKESADMENNYMIFASMYRYDKLFFNKEYTQEQYNKLFLLVEEPPIPFLSFIRKRIVKKSLKITYGINNLESYVETFEYYTLYKTLTLGVLSNILYQIFLKYGKLSICEILDLDDFNFYFNKACVHFGIKERESFLEFLKDEAEKEAWKNTDFENETDEETEEDEGIDLETYYSIYEKYPEWMQLTKGNIFVGFDLARAIYISGYSYQLKYISAPNVQEMIDFAGERILSLFDSWASFFASCMLGKFWMEQVADASYLTPINEYLSAIYGMLTQPSNPLAKSGIWPKEDYTELIIHIEKIIKAELHNHTGNIIPADFTSLTVQHPELKSLIALIYKYEEVNKYFNKTYKNRINLIGEKDYWDPSIEEWLGKQMEPDEVFLATSGVPWPMWLSNKSLYYRKGYLFGEINKVSLSHLNTELSFNLYESDYEIKINISTLICTILELSYETKENDSLSIRFLSKKAMEEWHNFFMDLKNLS